MCTVEFTFNFPHGTAAGWEDDSIRPDELDPDMHCHACHNIICLICKAVVCTEPEEMHYIICNNYPTGKKECELCYQKVKTM